MGYYWFAHFLLIGAGGLFVKSFSVRHLLLSLDILEPMFKILEFISNDQRNILFFRKDSGTASVGPAFSYLLVVSGGCSSNETYNKSLLSSYTLWKEFALWIHLLDKLPRY